MKSNNTVNTYRDGLTVFRKYLAEEKKVSIRKFRFEECTHDFLLEYMMYLKDKGCAAGTCNNRLAAIRSYLWYVADGEISMQSIALGASKVPFIKGTQKVIILDFRKSCIHICSEEPGLVDYIKMELNLNLYPEYWDIHQKLRIKII